VAEWWCAGNRGIGLSGETGRGDTRNLHRETEGIRAVRRGIGLLENLIAAFDQVNDELAEAEDEVADAAIARHGERSACVR
jgi:hypothetical protein